MIKYYITIVERKTGTVHNLIRNEETITPTIEKELGGWENLHSACTTGLSKKEKEYFTAGTTKDNNKCFSILAVEE